MHPLLQQDYAPLQAWTLKNNPQGKQEEKAKKDKADKKGAKDAGKKKKK